MTALTPVFHAECETIQLKHQGILLELSRLDLALERLVCYSEVFADLGSLEYIRQTSRRIATELPKHCRSEEDSLLSTVAGISAQLAQFAAEMKRQHKELLLRLQAFCSALVALDSSSDLYAAICELKDTGRELTRRLREHITLEERELRGFLN